MALLWINVAAFLLLVASLTCTASNLLTFSSGAADTTQLFSVSHFSNNASSIAASDSAFLVRRHHLVCFHLGPPPNSTKHFPSLTNLKNREQCCADLWNQGLLELLDKKYCLDHIALVPSVDVQQDIRPIYYLALDEREHSTSGCGSFSTELLFRQVRRVKVSNRHQEKEHIHDLPLHGVPVYSPFHLADLTFPVKKQNAPKDTAFIKLSIPGKVTATLSKEGGMHRAFHQKVTLPLKKELFSEFLELETISTKQDILNYKLNVTVVVYLPLMESIFLDADDPFIARYEKNSPQGVSCRASLKSSTASKETNATPIFPCCIQFFSSETIDIEQPSFASRQYVVAFQLNATLDLNIDATNFVASETMEVFLDYGSTLHIRYPSPVHHHQQDGNDSVHESVNGLVPIAIQQPILYSAMINVSRIAEHTSSIGCYIFDPVLTQVEDEQWANHLESDPIIIYVAAGLSEDYWWVTLITMTSALLGGLVLLKTFHSVSIWC